MNDTLAIQIEDGVAEVVLNRPEKKNAMSMEMFEDLIEAGTSLASEKGLRAVILTGAGGTFCAGLDLTLMQAFAGRLDEIKAQMGETLPGGGNKFQKPIIIWQELQVPVIAAIEGPCFGAGMQLALAADFRIAQPTARLSIMEAKWGLIPDMGITQSLPYLVRADVAKRMMMTAEVVEGTAAEALGLVTQISETPLEAAREMAARLKLSSPQVLSGSKALVDRARRMDRDSALALEAELQAALMGTPNQMASVMAQMPGKPATYE